MRTLKIAVLTAGWAVDSGFYCECPNRKLSAANASFLRFSSRYSVAKVVSAVLPAIWCRFPGSGSTSYKLHSVGLPTEEIANESDGICESVERLRGRRNA